MFDDDEYTPEELELMGLSPRITTSPLLPAPGKNPYTSSALTANAYTTPGNVDPEDVLQRMAEDSLLPDSVVRDDRALTRIVDLSLAQIQERLLFGDRIPDKYGQLQRVPIPAATLSQLVKMGIEQRDAARHKYETAPSATDKLMIQLIDELKGRAPSKRAIIDVELYDSNIDETESK